jgi:hypothetical protein
MLLSGETVVTKRSLLELCVALVDLVVAMAGQFLLAPRLTAQWLLRAYVSVGIEFHVALGTRGTNNPVDSLATTASANLQLR